jgi:CIC family chloride channel protein
MMIFELTQKVDIIPPLMAACVVSTLVATRLQRDSIYTMKLRRRGIDLHEEESHNVLARLFVRDVVDREPEVLGPSASFNAVVERVLGSNHAEFFVVDEAGHLRGAIRLRALARMLVEQDALRPLVVAGDILETGLHTVTEDENLDVVMQLFSQGEAEEIPVVDVNDPRRLVGCVHKRDLIHAYNQEILRRDLAGALSSTVLVASKGQQVELGGDYVLQEIQPPPRFFGRTLRELDLGQRTGVQVVLLRKRSPDGGRRVEVPTAEHRIDEGDRLVVAGKRAAVESLDTL